MRARIAFGAGAAIIALSAAVGCSGAQSSGASGGGSGAERSPATSAGAAALDSGILLEPSIGHQARAELRLPQSRSTVIKTAQLSLRVKSDRFADAIDEARQVAGSLGGMVLSTDVVRSEPSIAQVVVRVPADRFDAAISDLRHLAGGTVRSEKIAGQDVGQDFVDLESRERNLRAQQKVLLRLMDRAVSISDTIRVQNELSQVQGQIEQIRGRLLYLHDQADLSTISISMRETDVAAAASKPGALHRAFSRAWHGTVSVVTGVIVGAGVVIPVALLLGAAGFVAFRLWRPIHRRLEGVPPPPAG
jgi:hypothetical protein